MIIECMRGAVKCHAVSALHVDYRGGAISLGIFFGHFLRMVFERGVMA